MSAPLNFSVQLSLGRFAVTADANDTLKALKTAIRVQVAALNHVNFKLYRFNLAGAYLSDESKTLNEVGVGEGAILHALKKSTCPRAAVDTEKPSADE